MALDALNMVDIIEEMENHIANIRPPEHVRKDLDIGYELDNQSVILFEIRPVWNDRSQIRNHNFAKATFDKKNNVWKIYWLRANLKWYPYDVRPKVNTLKEFLDIVEKDEFGCFYG